MINNFNDPAAGSPTATLLRLTSYLLFIIQSLDSSSWKTSEIVTDGVYKLQGLIQYALMIHTYWEFLFHNGITTVNPSNNVLIYIITKYCIARAAQAI